MVKFKIGDRSRSQNTKERPSIKDILQTGRKISLKSIKSSQQNPVTYRLKDVNGEETQGSTRIDQVIRRDYKKRPQALVKWKGYSDEFNSWVPFEEITTIN